MAMPTDDLKPRIREFLSRSFDSSALTDDDDIFAAGRVTSLFAMELVVFIEERIGVRLDDADLDRENFKSINSMASLIERKRAAQSD